MLIPNPILLGQTPAGGFVLPITAERGGLAGYILLGQFGPAADVERSTDDGETWQALIYPHTLVPGERLRLTRTNPSPLLTTIRGLGPVDGDVPPDEGDGGGGGGGGSESFTVSRTSDGFLTTSATLTRDADGFLTTDTSLSRDADGFLSAEGSTP